MERNNRIAGLHGQAEVPCAATDDPPADELLLDRYLLKQDELAFAVLIERYGPLVLGVCKRVLQDQHAAEDAFQATFLALALQAASLKHRGPLGSWLYTVAFRTARKMRIATARRRATEKRVEQMPTERPEDEAAQNELRTVLDEELNQLQEKYRALLVLVYLEGKAHQEAAAELGWPSGSVSRRIARARELLRGRLARRGVVLSTALLVVMMSKASAKAAVSAQLVSATVKGVSLGLAGALAAGSAATGAASPAGESLLRGLLHALKLKIGAKLAIGLILLAAVGTVGGMVVHNMAAPKTPLMGGVTRPGSCGWSPGGMGHAGPGLGWQTWQTFDGNLGPVHAVAFVTPERFLVATEGEGKAPPMRLWDTEMGPQNKTLLGNTGPFSAATFSADATLLAAAGNDQVIKLWDVATRAERATIETPDTTVLALAFAPDSTLLASAGLDQAVRVWDVATGQQRHVLEGHMGPVSAVAFSPDGSLLAAGSRTGMVKLWDICTNRERSAANAHGDVVSSLAFAPDGKTLVTGSWDQTLKCWDMSLTQRNTLVGHTDQICCVAFAPDGKTLVSGSRDKTGRVWEAATGRNLGVLRGHAAAVEIVVFDRGGTRLATASSDHGVKVWQSATRRGKRHIAN